MRKFHFFSRRMRILSLGFFLGLCLCCKVPTTSVSLFYATLATSMEFFDDRWIYYVGVQNGGSFVTDLSIEGRPRAANDMPYRSLEDVKLLKRDDSLGRERYELLSWRKLQGLWMKVVPEEERGNLAIGWEPSATVVVSGGNTISIPPENVVYHPLSVGIGRH